MIGHCKAKQANQGQQRNPEKLEMILAVLLMLFQRVRVVCPAGGNVNLADLALESVAGAFHVSEYRRPVLGNPLHIRQSLRTAFTFEI